MAAVDTTVERPPRNLLGITPVSLRFVEERIARRASDTVPVSVEMRVEVSQQRLHRQQMVTRPYGDDRTSGDAARRPFADTGPVDARLARDTSAHGATPFSLRRTRRDDRVLCLPSLIRFPVWRGHSPWVRRPRNPRIR